MCNIESLYDYKNGENIFGYEFILVGFNRDDFPKEETQIIDLKNSIRNMIRQNYGFGSFCYVSLFESKKWLCRFIKKSIKEDEIIKKNEFPNLDRWFE